MNQTTIDVLQTLNPSFLPEKLLFREKEYSQLLSNIKNSVNTIVYGPDGSGKTTLLRKASLETNSNKSRVLYIDCSLYKTANAVLREILIDRPIASRSNYDLLKRLIERARNIKFAACLDHIENLEEKEIMGQLMQAGVCVVFACTSHEYFLSLAPGTRASVVGVIELITYSQDQAFEILKNRVKSMSNPFSEKIIKKIADKTEGNLTISMNVLKAAAMKADSQKKSLEEIELDEILLEHDCPERLNLDEKLLIRILQEWKSLPASRLLDFYVQKARHPRSERAFRNYMENLCSKGLVKALGERRGRTYEIIEGDLNG